MPETDRAIDGTPEDLLERMLELTGKQQTLDEFRTARAKLATARQVHQAAQVRLLSEQRELDRLRERARRHDEYLQTERRHSVIVNVELPMARRRALEAQREDLRRERDQRANQLQQATEELERLARELPELEKRLRGLEREASRLRREDEESRGDLERIAGEAREANLKLQQAEEAVAAGHSLVTLLDSTVVEQFEHDAAVAGQRLVEAEAEREQLAIQIAELEAGRVPPPIELIRFRAKLADLGIGATCWSKP